MQKVAAHVTALPFAMLILAAFIYGAGQAFAVLPGDELPIADRPEPRPPVRAPHPGGRLGRLRDRAARRPLAGDGVRGRRPLRRVPDRFVRDDRAGPEVPVADLLVQLDRPPPADGRRHRLAVGRPARGRRPSSLLVARRGRLPAPRHRLDSALSWLRLPTLPGGVGGPYRRQLSDRTAIALAGGAGIGLYAALIASVGRRRSSRSSSRPAAILELIQQVYPGDRPHPAIRPPAAGLRRVRPIILGLAGATSSRAGRPTRADGRLDLVLADPGPRVRWVHPERARGARRDRVIAAVVIAVLVASPIALVGRRRRLAGPSASLVLGLAAAAFAAIGLAVGGLIRSSARGAGRGRARLATFLIDILGPALKLPDASSSCPSTSTSASRWPARTTRSGSSSRPSSSRSAGCSSARGACAARHRPGNVRAWTPCHRARRPLGGPARRLERPAQDRRRPAPGRDRRDARGGRRDRARSGSLVWSPAGGPPCRSRGSRSGSRRAPSRPATSSCSPRPTGAATCRSSTRSPAGRRRSSRSRSASLILGERLGVAGSIGVVAAARRVPVAPAAVADRRSRAGGAVGTRGGAIDASILFALATGVTIATYTRHRPGRHPAHRPVVVRRDPLAGDLRLPGPVGHARGRRRHLLRRPEENRRAAVGGWLTLGAYLCILVALSVAPLSGCRPAARVGDGLRRGLGVGPARRGRGPRRGHVRRIGRVGADRRRRAPARDRRLAAGSTGAMRLGRPRSAGPAPEDPPPAEPAVDEADARDDERGPEDQPAVDRLLRARGSRATIPTTGSR